MCWIIFTWAACCKCWYCCWIWNFLICAVCVMTNLATSLQHLAVLFSIPCLSCHWLIGRWCWCFYSCFMKQVYVGRELVARCRTEWRILSVAFCGYAAQPTWVDIQTEGRASGWWGSAGIIVAPKNEVRLWLCLFSPLQIVRSICILSVILHSLLCKSL